MESSEGSRVEIILDLGWALNSMACVLIRKERLETQREEAM